MKKIKSKIPLNYITIKTTQSRIDKGLLAIPTTLLDLFPKEKSKIRILNNEDTEEVKSFTPYTSSSRECRIGGMKAFYEEYDIRDGDELVILLIDDDKYKIIPEKLFENTIMRLENNFDKTKNGDDFENIIETIALTTNQSKENIIKSEFSRLSQGEVSSRKVKQRSNLKVRESIPFSLKKILLELYKGKCQISNFTFNTKNGKPYFEIHHLIPQNGHHFKNLLVVSPNVHAQFTYANVEHYFDNEGWLRKVKFNRNEYQVFQIIDKLQSTFFKESHY